MIRPLTLCFGFLFLSACGTGDKPQDLGASVADTKILDGVPLSSAEAPQMAAVLITSRNPITGEEEFGLCSGTIIAPTKVLTAAHCFHAPKIERVEVAFPEAVFYVTDVYIHPSHVSTSDGFQTADIAVLVTDTDMGRPGLPLLVSRPVQVGDTIGIYGYGYDENYEIGQLRGGEMTVNFAQSIAFFATYDDQSNTCFGDSGGPAVLSLFDQAGNVAAAGIVGTLSTGTAPDCSKGDRNRFMNIQWDYLLDFILAVAPEAKVI